ncbi:MAG: ABC transporter permease [Thermoleophilia bacterium]|nr:ABC transporter permease [Thermoleophilia bacterium]
MSTAASPADVEEFLDGAARARRTGRVDPVLLSGCVIVGFFIVCAIFAPWIAPHDPDFQQADGLNGIGPWAPFDSSYLLGTDELGRDYLSRLIYGARVAIFIAIVPNAIAMVIATLVGVSAGYFRGRVDTILMRITETVMVLPAFLLALALISVAGSGLWVVVIALVLVSWTYAARVVYGEVLRIREATFIEAARALGASSWRIIFRHVIPQLRGLLVTYFTLNAAFMVLTEAGLGFLGFGIQPPTPSWGAMIGASRDLLFWPWLIILPGVCLALLGMGFYLLGEGLQRRFGPRVPTARL